MQPKLRERYFVCSFTILSYRLIQDTAKRNGLSWDVVFSCEGIGKYKLLPEAYETVAGYLQLDVGECLMVACHNWDLDAARAVGFKTAFVRRADEWGPESPPHPDANPDLRHRRRQLPGTGGGAGGQGLNVRTTATMA